MPKLILFDIDETILYSDGVGRRAMEAALKAVFDKRIDAGTHNMSGKTDPQICHELLSALGYSREEIDSGLPAAFDYYLMRLEEEISLASRFGLHAGVLDLLAALQELSDCRLGLLTGNIEPGARLKLRPFDLNRFFAFGAFGSDSADRMDLPSIAHERAKTVFGIEFDIGEIVIIGDAVNDVLCAKGYGVRSIITATGKTSKETLKEHNPDFLFDSLADTGAILESIFSQ